MKKLTGKIREKLLRGAMIASVLLLLTGAVLLWENRRGTPGEPADFYRTVLRDGLAINYHALEWDAGYGCPQYLVVDLSRTGLREAEKAEILGSLEEDCAALPNLLILDLPITDIPGYEVSEAVEQATGIPFNPQWDRVYPLVYWLETELPPPESFGVEPIRVDCQTTWGGWTGRRTAYIHYPSGWKVYEKGMEYQIS